MKKGFLRKFLVFMLSLGMIFSAVLPPGSAVFADDTASVWKELTDIDAAAEASAEGKSVAITMTSSNGKLCALPTKTTSSAPVAKPASTNGDEELVISGAKNDYGWTVTKTDDGNGNVTYTFNNSDGKYLYLTNNNNGVRVGDKPDTGGDWKLNPDPKYLTAVDSKPQTRYMGLYTPNGSEAPQDWRCYTSINNNIKDQTLKFWVYDRDETVGPAVISPISDALAASSGEFTVKGVITFIEIGSNGTNNIYIQDATGAICVRTTDAVTSIAVGDTITANGSRGTYSNKLPQLNNATFTKVTEASDQIALTATETTIGELTDTDICKYVTIKDLTVTSAGANVDVKDANDNTIQIYKAVLGATTLKEGDVIDFTGAVGYYNNYQLRNTMGTEIVVTSTAPPTPVTGDEFGLVSTIADGDEVIIYNPDSGRAIGNTIGGTDSNPVVEGVSFVPDAGVITTDKTGVVWTVRDNGDGTISFVQDEKVLGGKENGTKGQLVLTEADHPAFIPLGPDDEDFNYFLKFSDGWSNNFGSFYLEYYNGFTAYSASSPTKDKFGFNFYKKGADPETPGGVTPVEDGDVIKSLDELTDGQLVAIYSPSKKIAAGTADNGGWYLAGRPATVTSEGKISPFTTDYIWKVKVNTDGTYTFLSYNDENDSLIVWPSGNYAELAVNTKYSTNNANTWVVEPAASTPNAFTIKSATLRGGANSLPAYVKGNVRNGTNNFAGAFTDSATGADYALKFYKMDPAGAVTDFDDGEWDGVLTKGKKYVMYNDQTATAGSQLALGIYKEANYAFDAIPSELTTDTVKKAVPGNGAYVFEVDTTGRYYTFKNNGKYLATNNDEVLFFVDPLTDGSAPGNAKWYLEKQSKDGKSGYIIYNKTAHYNGSAVCIEYYSSVFSGWTFSTKNPLDIYLFNFFELAEDTKVYDDVVQVPTVLFDCKDNRYIEQNFPVTITLDDLCPEITNAVITYTAGTNTGTIDATDATVCEVSSDRKNYSFTIPASAIDGTPNPTELIINIEVSNAYGITYTGVKNVNILDEPFIENMTPAPGSQSGDEKKPVISAKIGNAGANPTFKMTLNENEVSGLVFDGGVLSYTPENDMEDGRVAAVIEVTREDGVSARKMWTFTIGTADYQQYFGQLHAHTAEYSDGQGSLADAFAYIESLPESANVQFVAFTDHSNYFDSTAAANPADALNDKTQMVAASKAKWEEYKSRAASFNALHTDIIALAGFEMTWSGGPGHINTFDSDGLVSRNNADLNNKTNDAGMKLYYETLKKGDSISQFNHPGSTFGTFSDFSYWDEETDARIFLIEVGNGEGQIGAGGYFPSYEEYTKALDKGWHLAPTNNQDNHKGRWGNANDARDVILTNDFSEQGLYDAIRAMRVYSTEDKNLKIGYTVNGEPMGTILSDSPDKLNLEVTLYDPDASDKISKVEVIVNGGRTVHTWNDAEELSKGYLTAELDPTYTYYYIRVTQEDKDLAVTAPVWTGKTATMGINSVVASKNPTIVNQEMTLTTSLYNGTASAVKVKNLVYTKDGSKVIGSDTAVKTIPADGTLNVSFNYTPDVAKKTKITVTATIESGGVDYDFSKDVTFSVRENDGPLPVVPISTVQAQTDSGYEYAIEGVVTSNASGYDRDTAFFDCIYVQDETAGICCFPVSGEFKIGDKVHIEGHTDFYQGEMELQVDSIEIIGTGSVEPTEVTAAQVNDKSVLGSLVTVKGTVVSFEKESGLVQTIMVEDAAGDVVRVFIDGYITQAEDVANCEVGAKITVTGLASYDDTFNAPEGPFPRIRIRNRRDVVVVTVDKAREQALEELNAVNIRDYSKDELNAVLDALDAARTAIGGALSIDEIEAALAEAKAVIGAQKTNAQKEEDAADAAAEELQSAKNAAKEQLDAIDLSKYSGEQLAIAEKAIADARAKIDAASSLTDVITLVVEAKIAVSACTTDAELSARELEGAKKFAKSQITAVDKTQYSGAELAAVEAAQSAAIAEIDKATSMEAISRAITDAKTVVAKQKTNAQKAAEAKRKAEDELKEWKGTLKKSIPSVKSPSFKAAKKSIKVSWKKANKANLKKFDTIEIQVCTDKKFAKANTKRVIVKKGKTSSTIKGLTKGKTYYVRIRNVKGSGVTKQVSKWSKIKKVKVK